ncbi:uncharacterized protein LOC132793141 [Drosophila nasuta]|uniref:uncharacterized protein LOC132793141 n=1 Tax=Drosophila nasuta TaxID=42062 RepID=UPI00295E6EE0|nr:uncharacterized protein LOC132793141 [Drosophila nasuta]
MLQWLTILLALEFVFALQEIEDPRQQDISWWQSNFYQSHWQQRKHFTKPTNKKMRIMEEVRKVYPCYCYKPKPQKEGHSTPKYEKYMTETKDLFFLNK